MRRRQFFALLAGGVALAVAPVRLAAAKVRSICDDFEFDFSTKTIRWRGSGEAEYTPYDLYKFIAETSDKDRKT